MYVFKKHVSRRAVLKGVGATIALPLLDAMNPAATAWAQTAAGAPPNQSGAGCGILLALPPMLASLLGLR